MHDITAFVTGDGAATTAIDSLLNFESALGLKGFLGRTRKSNKAQK
jgi:hypothetical protein